MELSDSGQSGDGTPNRPAGNPGAITGAQVKAPSEALKQRSPCLQQTSPAAHEAGQNSAIANEDNDPSPACHEGSAQSSSGYAGTTAHSPTGNVNTLPGNGASPTQQQLKADAQQALSPMNRQRLDGAGDEPDSGDSALPKISNRLPVVLAFLQILILSANTLLLIVIVASATNALFPWITRTQPENELTGQPTVPTADAVLDQTVDLSPLADKIDELSRRFEARGKRLDETLLTVLQNAESTAGDGDSQQPNDASAPPSPEPEPEPSEPSDDTGNTNASSDGVDPWIRRALTSIGTKTNAIEKQLRETRVDLAADLDSKFQTLGKAVVNEIRIGSDSLREKIHTLAVRLEALEKRSARDAAQEDVALVFMHSRRLDGSLFQPVVENIFFRDDYRTLFRNYRLGLFLGAEGKLNREIVGFNAPAGELTAEQLRFGEPNTGLTELTHELDPLEFFQGSPRSKNRRLVIVASAEAKPPAAEDARWGGVSCFVILVDLTGKLEEGTSPAWKAWNAFCKRGSEKGQPGEAAMVSFAPKPGEKLTADSLDEFTSRLCWYIRPRVVSNVSKQE